MKQLIFKRDEVIFKQGDFKECMYEIVSGSVGVCVGYGTEAEKQLTILRSGDTLGEMGLIETYPRSATAIALEDGTELREIDAKEFAGYFKTQPERLLAIMRQISELLRQRTEDYEEACQVLDSLKGTRGAPEKRSRSLLGRMKELIDFYNKTMAETAADPDLYIGASYPYYTHRM